MDRKFDQRHLRTLTIVGDVHGCYTTLRTLATTCGYDHDWRHPDATPLAFVGDLINRGPESLHTLLLAMCLTWPDSDGTSRAICVAGNHEYKAARHLRTGRTDGGPALAATLADIRAAADIIGRHRTDGHAAVAALQRRFGPLDPAVTAWLPDLVTGMADHDVISWIAGWLSDLPHHVVADDGNVVIAHAGLLPHLHGRDSRTAAQQAMYGITGRDRDGRRTRADFADAYEASAHNGTVVVCGHYHTLVETPHTHIIDSDAVAGRGLTAVTWPARHVTTVPTAPCDTPAAQAA